MKPSEVGQNVKIEGMWEIGEVMKIRMDVDNVTFVYVRIVDESTCYWVRCEDCKVVVRDETLNAWVIKEK